jgi:primosomal protein N' (replication factor Y)
VCGKNNRVPTACPSCHGAEIIHKGIGTKLIESEIAKLFPEKVIARFDGDTQLATTLEKRYQELYDGKIDIIIGTQVVAKGLDLPHLRTVGVIQADAGLSLPDYIASERTFQLISQVIGRVGRSAHKTSVILQSYQPDHPAIKLGITQNYQEFYQTTLSERRGRGFPPFTYLLKLTCIYKTERAAIRNSQQLANTVKNSFPHVAVLGPTPAFYERQYNSYRWQLLVQSKKRSTLLEIVSIVPPSHWQVDLDPYTLL